MVFGHRRKDDDSSDDEKKKPGHPVTNNKIKFGHKKKTEGAGDSRPHSRPHNTKPGAKPNNGDTPTKSFGNMRISKKNAVTKFTGKATKFEDVEFDNLPKKARDAVETLGFTKESWDSNEGWPNCEDCWWSELSEEEREAVIELGWDQSAWDEKYEDKYWADIPKEVQEAATALGFTQEIWDNEEWPELGYWDELSPEQKSYVHVLGYASKWKWD